MGMVKRCICISHPTFDDGETGIEETKRIAEVFLASLQATMSQSEVSGGLTTQQKDQMKAYLNQFRFLIRKLPNEIVK